MQSKSMDWCLYERGLHHERVKEVNLDEYSCRKKRREVVTPQNILLLLLRNAGPWLQYQLELVLL